jgi:hypothetical protein
MGWLSGLLTVAGSDNVVGGLHPHEISLGPWRIDTVANFPAK